MNERLSPTEQIEKNKDKTNLRPALRFVEEHDFQYAANLERFLQAPEYEESRAFADDVAMEDVPEGQELQITPDQIRSIIAHVSPELLRLSKLETVNFKFHDYVAIPKFNDEGIFDLSLGVDIKQFDAFAQSDLHKERMLIGSTHLGKLVTVTGVPPSVSKDSKAINLFQHHVFLHELFHTIEWTLRSKEASEKILMNDGPRTLADWAEDYLVSLQDERELTTEYAESYSNDMFDQSGNLLPDVTPYDHAVREDMAEAFVASHFDIISNSKGYTSFASHSFGNSNVAQTLQSHNVASKKAALMKELRTATFKEI